MKRAFDLAAAGLGLLLLLPVFLMVGIAVRVTLGSPVLFRQRRPGLHGEPFVIYKFRTMRDERRPSGDALPDGERLTRLGRWLRRTSLDELPELVNVWKGEMSLVGPRPLLMDYLPLYDAKQARRHDVRPGITGLAQVSGRNALTWEEKFELDVWYVDHHTFLLDLKILAQTVFRVLGGDGVTQTGQATAEPFTGTRVR